jgi:hypothetical protein
MWWLKFTLARCLQIGVYLLGGNSAGSHVVLSNPGRIRIHGERPVYRAVHIFERFGHWLLATSFIVRSCLSLCLWSQVLILPLAMRHFRSSP